MSIKILDCTLRDGAYVVDSVFGESRIKNIIKKLQTAKIDIIECGWLRNTTFQKDSVSYSIPDDLQNYVETKTSKFALMFDYGKYDIKNLVKNDGLVDIIRIAFYKNSLDEISFEVENIKSKGYEVYLQPSNIMEYSEKDIDKLVSRSNFLGVDSLYIVDSFGSMYPGDLLRILPSFDSNLDKTINLGFHSHNSIQLSFALSILFIKSVNRNNVSVDSTLCGIGRGAGNTKTELLSEYINKFEKIYNTNIIWDCIKHNIEPLYSNFNWEYTPERARKGILGLHPNAKITPIL